MFELKIVVELDIGRDALSVPDMEFNSSRQGGE